MSFSDDILTAYAHGELDHATRHAVEQAMRRDAVLAQRVARLQGSRRRLAGPRHGATVVQLAAVRATRAATRQAERKARKGWHWTWREWSVLALILLLVLGLGVAAGKFGLSGWRPDPHVQPGVAWRDGALMAQGRLAQALDQAPGGTAGVYSGSVRIVSSFVSSEGAYCRSFTATGGAEDLAGLACKSGGGWKLPVLMQQPRAAGQGGEADPPVLAGSVSALATAAATGTMADAATLPAGGAAAVNGAGSGADNGAGNGAGNGSHPARGDASGIGAGAHYAPAELPAAVQAVVEQRSSGAVLDAAAEQQAMRKDWLR